MNNIIAPDSRIVVPTFVVPEPDDRVVAPRGIAVPTADGWVVPDADSPGEGGS